MNIGSKVLNNKCSYVYGAILNFFQHKNCFKKWLKIEVDKFKSPMDSIQGKTNKKIITTE